MRNNNKLGCSDCIFYQCYIHNGKHGMGIYDSCKINNVVLENGVCDCFLKSEKIVIGEK